MLRPARARFKEMIPEVLPRHDESVTITESIGYSPFSDLAMIE
jgi:hypothetical protein